MFLAAFSLLRAYCDYVYCELKHHIYFSMTSMSNTLKKIHSLKKKWVIVIFSPKKDYSVVPINWLIETETEKLSTSTIQHCYWPPIRVTSTDIEDAENPDPSWCQYKIRVVGGNKTYSM
eukprot:XP_016656358.1 PREDICTED: uncharacterized protein LOC107882486 [Acyrthosiphon pisum]